MSMQPAQVAESPSAFGSTSHPPEHQIRLPPWARDQANAAFRSQDGAVHEQAGEIPEGIGGGRTASLVGLREPTGFRKEGVAFRQGQRADRSRRAGWRARGDPRPHRGLPGAPSGRPGPGRGRRYAVGAVRPAQGAAQCHPGSTGGCRSLPWLEPTSGRGRTPHAIPPPHSEIGGFLGGTIEPQASRCQGISLNRTLSPA